MKKNFSPPSPGFVLIYGFQSVKSALENPRRVCTRLWYTQKSLDPYLAQACMHRQRQGRSVPLQKISSDLMATWVGGDATPQGVALEARPLSPVSLEDVVPQETADLAQNPILLMLDQITDPQNVGAILRSAAAFGALGVITQERHSPNINNPTLCKIACGGIEHVPLIQVTNLARTLEYLKKQGYWCIGLDEKGTQALGDIALSPPTVLVLGAEGPGLRQLVKEKCDFLISLPTRPAFGTLNVSNAAAISLYELCRSKTLSKNAKKCQ